MNNGGGRATRNMYGWGVPWLIKKGGLGCEHSPKGVGLRCGHNQKNEGLRCGYNPKKGGGVFGTGFVKREGLRN